MRIGHVIDFCNRDGPRKWLWGHSGSFGAKAASAPITRNGHDFACCALIRQRYALYWNPAIRIMPRHFFRLSMNHCRSLGWRFLGFCAEGWICFMWQSRRHTVWPPPNDTPTGIATKSPWRSLRALILISQLCVRWKDIARSRFHCLRYVGQQLIFKKNGGQEA